MCAVNDEKRRENEQGNQVRYCFKIGKELTKLNSATAQIAPRHQWFPHDI